jgi:hypothetical protein
MKFRSAPTLILAAAIVTLAVTGCAGSGSASSSSSQAAAVATSSAPVAQPSSTPTESPIAQWCASQDYTDNEDAVGDANQTVQDVDDNDYTAAATDGYNLEITALKAGSELPPVGSHLKLEYGLYFGWLSIVGKDDAAGNLPAADSAAEEVVKYRGAVQRVDAQCTALGD